MPRFPFHKYLGPGNTLNEGSPVDTDDEIAFEHDSAYESAKSDSDIKLADDIAIEKFSSDFWKNKNWHSAIGSIGLRAKRFVEGYTGVLYPNMGPTREYHAMANRRGAEKQLSEAQLRWRDENYRRHGHHIVGRRPHGYSTPNDHPSENPAPKKQRGDNPPTPGEGETSAWWDEFGDDIEMEGGMDITDAAGPNAVATSNMASGAPSGHGGEHLIPISRGIYPRSEYYTFRNTRLITTWGYTSVNFLTGTQGSTLRHRWSTSLSHIPVETIYWYLSPAEYDALPPGATVESVNVKVYAQGNRVSFDTGTTLTGSANATHVVFGQHCIGLNLDTHSTTGIYTTDPAAPMVPTAFANVTTGAVNTMVAKLWGETARDIVTTNVPTSYNAIRHMNWYNLFTENTLTGNMGLENSAYQRIDNVIHKYNFQQCIGKELINYHYKPRRGQIKDRHMYQPILSQQSLYASASFNPKVQMQFTTGAENQGVTQQPVGAAQLPTGDFNINYTSGFIEQANRVEYLDVPGNARQQPHLHIGILPVQSNSPSDTDNISFVNAAAYYQIDSSITIKIPLARGTTRSTACPKPANNYIHNDTGNSFQSVYNNITTLNGFTTT